MRSIPLHLFRARGTSNRNVLLRLFLDLVRLLSITLRLMGAEMKVPNWTDEEMILACRLAYLRNWKGVNIKAPGVRELSDLLRAKWRAELGSIGASDRSAGSVGMKVNNLIAHVTPGKGLRTSKAEWPIVEGFMERPADMLAEACVIEYEFRKIAGQI